VGRVGRERNADVAAEDLAAATDLARNDALTELARQRRTTAADDENDEREQRA